MTTPINKLIDSAVKCGKCGAEGVGTCDCWESCSCGWLTEKGTPCRNPNTAKCSTKVQYGKYSRG